MECHLGAIIITIIIRAAAQILGLLPSLEGSWTVMCLCIDHTGPLVFRGLPMMELTPSYNDRTDLIHHVLREDSDQTLRVSTTTGYMGWSVEASCLGKAP